MNSIQKNVIRRIVTPTLAIFCSLSLSAQSPESADTVKISLSGQQVVIPLPPRGNRTTVSFEKDNETIDVSVSRFGKNNPVFINEGPAPNADEEEVIKKVRWFTQFEVGYMGLQNKNILTDNLFEGVPMNSGEFIEITHLQTKSKHPSGLFINLTLKETERRLSGNNRYLVTGIKATFDYIQTTGGYSGFLYFTDSVYPLSSALVGSSFTVRSTSFGLVFPLAYREIYHPERKFPVRLEMGVNLAGKFSWRDLSDGFTSSYFGEDKNTVGLCIFPQPYVSVSKGAIGLFAAADIKPLSIAVNRQNRSQAYYFGLSIRPFHSFRKI